MTNELDDPSPSGRQRQETVTLSSLGSQEVAPLSIPSWQGEAMAIDHHPGGW